MLIYKRDIVYITSYLLGMNKTTFYTQYEHEEDGKGLWNKFEKIKEMKIIHELCAIRIAILGNSGALDSYMIKQLKNILTCEQYISQESVEYLKSQNIEIEEANLNSEKYIKRINTLINNHLGEIKNIDILPDWIPLKEYFNMFKMNNNTIKASQRNYSKYYGNYPFQLWVSFDMSNMNHNILRNDAYLLECIHRFNRQTPVDYKDKVCIDAKEIVSNKDSKDNTDNIAIQEFVKSGKKVLAVVDCENVTVSTVISVIREMEKCQKIYKIILIDDDNTIEDWGIVSEAVKTEIQHIQTKRLMSAKSVVDMQLALSVYKEKIENKVDKVVLLASDSDYMCLIDNVMDERTQFFVVYELDRVCTTYVKRLKESNVPAASSDEFEYIDLTLERKNNIIAEVVESINKEVKDINVLDMIERVVENYNISGEELRGIKEDVKKNMCIEINNNGDVAFMIGAE